MPTRSQANQSGAASPEAVSTGATNPGPGTPSGQNATVPIASDELARLYATISDLQSVVINLQARQNVNAPVVKDSEPCPPEPFQGKSATKLREFLTKLRLYFKAQPHRFPDDEAKITYAASYLQGIAFSWVQIHLEKDPPPAWLTDYSLFTAELTNKFGRPDRPHNASAHLRGLRQTGSVASYATEFLQAAAVLGWNDPPLIDHFYGGLKDAVKDELVKTPKPTDLESYIQMATNIDNRLHDRAMDRNRASRPTHLPPRKSYSSSRGRTASPPPASRDSAPTVAREPSTRLQERSSTRPRFQLPTDQERERRRNLNLCLYCGEPGHVIRVCPVRPDSRPHPARASEATLAVTHLQGNAPAQLQ
jgi:hypothetical protein